MRRSSGRQQTTVQRATPRDHESIDGISAFMEANVAPFLQELRQYSQLEYAEVLAAWAADPIHSAQQFDCRRVERFIQIADRRLESRVCKYSAPFFLTAIRSIPLPAMDWILIGPKPTELLRCVSIASSFILLFGQKSSADLATLLTNTHRAHKKRFRADIGAVLGGAYARVLGEGAYRYAAKGGRLKRPELIPAEGLTQIANSYPKEGIILLPGIYFEEDMPLQNSTEDYDQRRRQFDSEPSALPSSKPDLAEEPEFSWWRCGTGTALLENGGRIVISYPWFETTNVSNSFFVHPAPLPQAFETLRLFPENFSIRLGLNCETFMALCDAFSEFIRVRSRFDCLSLIAQDENEVHLASQLSPLDQGASQAQTVLHGLMARAGFFSRKQDIASYLTHAVRERLSLDPDATTDQLADEFLARFSSPPSSDHDLLPRLCWDFGESIFIDLLLMNEFFGLCLRQITTGDGETGLRRGRLFEARAREDIIAGLGMSSSQICVPPGFRVFGPDGADLGDVDMAFTIDNVLIHLDMKSWQRTAREFRGDHFAIKNRGRRLSEYLSERVRPRGARLLEFVRQRTPSVVRVRDFLCVAVVEWVSPYIESLRHNGIPVLGTPEELISKLSNPTHRRLLLDD
jgi:hypothetical protein